MGTQYLISNMIDHIQNIFWSPQVVISLSFCGVTTLGD